MVGQHGGGGEYEVQSGFGWTNGVVLALLEKYGSELTPPTPTGATFLLSSLAAARAHSSSQSSSPLTQQRLIDAITRPTLTPL
jgi:hypothetical protein